MSQSLYRFRSVDALLGPRAELERQEIYFASPRELNDPMEGFTDLFWQGDAIVWRSLFKNYLLCMMQSLSMVVVAGDNFDKSMCENFVHQTDADLPQAPIRTLYAEICDRFFAHDVVGDLITMLVDTSAKVRRDELAFYLRALNPLAFTATKAAFRHHAKLVDQAGLEIDAKGEEIALDHLKSLADAIKGRAEARKLIDTAFEVGAIQAMQMELIFDLNSSLTNRQKAWTFLAREFVEFHIAALERLVHPAWYAACFITDPTNAAMWGGYGDSHRGICLKFAAEPDGNGRSSLSLYRATGLGGGQDEFVTYYDYSPLPFEAVRYTNEYPEIDFFASLGAVPMGKLSHFWYAGPDGQRSASAAKILGKQDEWREGYWKHYHAGRISKTTDWAHESEHRLVLDSGFDQPRALKYRFKDLSGLSFGIKTTSEDKLRIMKLIEQKCLAEGRTNFEFYQARYSLQTRKVELVPLHLLKIAV